MPLQQAGLNTDTITGYIQAVKDFSQRLANEGFIGLDVI